MKKTFMSAALALTVVALFAFKPAAVTAKNVTGVNTEISTMKLEAGSFSESVEVFSDEFVRARKTWTEETVEPGLTTASLDTQDAVLSTY